MTREFVSALYEEIHCTNCIVFNGNEISVGLPGKWPLIQRAIVPAHQ